jgi:intracellular multiplication protein IcmC
MSAGNDGWSWLTNHVDVLNNVANNLLPVQKLVTGASYVIGLAFAFKAIYTLKAYGESRAMMSSNANLKEPIFYLIAAAMFIYFPTGLAIVLNTTFGSSSILQYAPINENHQGLAGVFANSGVGRSLKIIIQTIGVIAFVRGWVLIARSGAQGQQPGTAGKGLIHVVGGVLAINIIATLNMINNTLYGTG